MKGADVVQRMNDVLAHRGPDGEGIFKNTSETVILGSRRLSIVDVASGQQPVEIEHDGFKYAIVFNGEIFNHKAIRAELTGKYAFKTHSDTEVLLCSYIEWGYDCLDKLNGQYAFVIYDEKKNEIFFARDRVGIKPLFYSFENETLIISSEPKGILSTPDFPREINPEAVAEHFLGTLTLVNGCEALNDSFFKGIKSLNPGAFGILSNSSLMLGEFYDVPIPENKDATLDHAKLMRKDLEEAIIEQLPDEVRFGTALSGGLDSSITTIVAARHSKERMAACAIRFEDTQENPDYEHAKIVAERENVKFLAPVLTSEGMMADLDALTTALDKPHDTVRQLGLFATYRNLHNEGCKVVLVGEGSDEFNLGYYEKSPGFKQDIDKCQTPEDFRKLLKGRAEEAKKFLTNDFAEHGEFEGVIERNVNEYYEQSPSADPVDRMEYYYIKKFLKYRLDANDRCAMAHSVEARVPFCDNEVIETSLAVPAELNLRNGTEKAVLRDAFRDILPEEVVERRKYALPESKDVRLYRLVLDAFDAQFETANDSVWKVLNKNYAQSLRNIAAEKIANIESGKESSQVLTAEIPLTQPVEFRLKHLFLLLTFMRWYQLYFVQKIFSKTDV